MWSYIAAGFAGLFLCYMLVAAVVGSIRGIRNLQLDSGLSPPRYALEIGKGLVFFIGAITLFEWLADPISYILKKYWPWLVGVIAVWFVIAYFIPDRYWRR